MGLAEELAKPAYAGLSDQAAADAINNATKSVSRPIPAIDINRYLMVTGKWPRIAALARGLISGPEGTVLAAVALAEAFEKLTAFDLEVPAYAAACNAQLDAAVAAGLIGSEERAAILAMAVAQQPAGLAAQLGCRGPVLACDVANVRAGIAPDANRWE